MKRYSVTPSSSRRKSTINPYNEDATASREELERLEQETTLVLQEIDKNISRGNAIINDRLIPVIKSYSNESKKVWNNAGFWKYFFEQSANVELNSYEDPIHPPTTDANTIANSRPSFFNDDEDSPQEDVPEEPKPQEIPVPEEAQPEFRKPLKPHIEESTPTWSVEQTKKFQASTPQLHKRPTTLQNRTDFDTNSLGIRPPVLTNTISSSEPTHSSPKKNSPVKIQTVRQSLDTYHKISLSPRKRTPAREDTRRRSSLIQNLINSSPTLPEPPILMSELANEESSPVKHKPLGDEQDNDGLFSPVILPPELSPVKRVSTEFRSKENTIQRFPTTPNFKARLSDGKDIMKTPLGVRIRYGGDDSDLQPPELHNVELAKNLQFDEEDGELEVLQLNSQEKRKSAGSPNKAESKRARTQPNDDNKNIFLDKTGSAGSTLYHSVLQQDNVRSVENTENNSQSRSISQLFDDLAAANSKDKPAVPAGDNDGLAQKVVRATEIKDLFSDMSGSQHDASQDHTDNSTSDLGSVLRERFKNLTNYGKLSK